MAALVQRLVDSERSNVGELDDFGGVVDRLKQGDEVAFRQVVDRFGEKILNFIYQMIGDRTVAEDLSQEVFIKVLTHAKHLRHAGVFTSWIYTIARHAAINHLRHRGVVQRLSPPPAPGPLPPSAFAENAELQDVINDAVAQIEEPFRTALVLCVLQGLSYEEAGRVMGCTPKTVSTRLFRARERFRQLVRPYIMEVP